MVGCTDCMKRFFRKKCLCGNTFYINRQDHRKGRSVNFFLSNRVSVWTCPICLATTCIRVDINEMEYIREHYDPKDELTIRAINMMVAHFI